MNFLINILTQKKQHKKIKSHVKAYRSQYTLGSWDDKYHSLKTYVKVHKKFPCHRDNKNLYLVRWFRYQKERFFYNKGLPLSKKKIRLLEAIPGWTWGRDYKPTNDSFNETSGSFDVSDKSETRCTIDTESIFQIKGSKYYTRKESNTILVDGWVISLFPELLSHYDDCNLYSVINRLNSKNNFVT